MDSVAKILLKYVKNIISRGNSTSSIQMDPKFGKKNFVRISNCRHIRFLLNGKKLDLYISAILGWNKFPDVGFDRAKSALQKPQSHKTQEYSLTEFLGTNCEHYHFCQRSPVCTKKYFFIEMQNKKKHVGECASS